jgi:hypothetical protein
MANKFRENSSVQVIINDGNLNTSTAIVTGRMRIDWNKYRAKKGLMSALQFSTSSMNCNVPDPSVITLSGDTDAGV